MKVLVTLREDVCTKHGELQVSVARPLIALLREMALTPILAVDSSDYFIDLLYDDSCAGLLLTGGGDPLIGSKRTDSEYLLIEHALNSDSCITGICRGMQVINCFFGGAFSVEDGHAGTVDQLIWEKLYANSNSLPRYVNSFHDNVIHRHQLASTLQPLAFDYKANVECAYDKKNRVFAVMWHPERPFGGRDWFKKSYLTVIRNEVLRA